MRVIYHDSSKVDGVLYWQCVCIFANRQIYHPSPRERHFLERVIRAYGTGRRLRANVQSAARGIVQTCKARASLRRRKALPEVIPS